MDELFLFLCILLGLAILVLIVFTIYEYKLYPNRLYKVHKQKKQLKKLKNKIKYSRVDTESSIGATSSMSNGAENIADDEVQLQGPPLEDDLDPGLEGPTEPSVGKRRALCIALKYRGKKRLHGSVLSINKFVAFLKKLNYDQIVTLTDFHEEEKHKPLKHNVLAAIHELVSGATSGDRLVFYYSGHGGKWTGIGPVVGHRSEIVLSGNASITDAELHKYLVRTLPEGVILNAFFDCCHSGTMLELPYHYRYRNEERISKLMQTNTKDRKHREGQNLLPDEIMKISERMNDELIVDSFSKQPEIAEIKAKVYQWSACLDNQVAYDVEVRGGFESVFTISFLKAYRNSLRKNFGQIVMYIDYHSQETLRSTIAAKKRNKRQRTLLCTSHIMDLHNAKVQL